MSQEIKKGIFLFIHVFFLCNFQQRHPSELEKSTIQKQRKELQLLIAELQDRDRELNEMVASHQKQMLAWERDRQRLLTLEQKCTRLQGESLTLICTF